ncbi:hypothetical protein [Streptomyces sp. NPDC008092]|uniref:hypothetical protein n=1 Tax=Streptomyces sp. NPDC008092 TaxID=3364808 RepID=UPI0036E4FC25
MGTITMDVGWDRSRQEVLLSRTCSYTLPARSGALARIRKDGYGDCGDYKLLRDGRAAETDGTKSRPIRVTQRSARAPAQVQSSFGLYLTRQSGVQRLTIALCPVAGPGGSELVGGGDYPDVWLITVRAPKWSFSGIAGTVESQSDSSLTWRVAAAPPTGKARTPSTCSVDLTRKVKTTKLPRARHQTRGEMLTALAAAVGGIGAVAAALVARLAGPAAPRRWAVATLSAGAAVCSFALVTQPASLAQLGSARFNNVFGTTPVALPADVWTPQAVLGLWLWYVLPVSAWWFTRRVVTGRPPSGRTLIAGCVPPLLCLAFMTAGGTVPNTGPWVRVAAAAVLALAVAASGRRLHTGTAVRRWAPTAGALLWTVLVTYELGRTAVIADDRLTVNGWNAAAVLICTWPAAAWLGSLLPPALRCTPRPAVRALCFVTLWAAVICPFAVAYLKAARYDVYGDRMEDDVWSQYRVSLFTGYSAWPLFVVTVCGVALQIAYLWRRGAMGGTGRAVEPVGRVLLVCAALTAYGSPDLRTATMWGEALATALVAVASLILLPLGSDASWARLRRVSRRGHARFMDRWITTQLIWDTRADFQRSARSALADDMTVPDFSDRWRELAVPGRNDDPETRLKRARRFALGTNAGRSPWTAGIVAAGRAQLLALPWAAYKAATSGTVGADYFMPFHLDAMFQTLRFTHWALYGFVYGYFYALLRGLTPVGKAAWLMLAILPAEILPLATLTVDPQYSQAPSVNDLVTGCAGVAGQTLVLCMLLGLWWEWSLARAAGMKWSQVRNFRRLSSVTVPVGTILVAGATAFATTVAGTWAQPELKQPDAVRSTQPTQQSEPSP